MSKKVQSAQLSDGTTLARLAEVANRIKATKYHQPRARFNDKHIVYLQGVLDELRRFADPIDAVMDVVTGYIYIFHGFHRWTAAKSSGHFHDAAIRLHMPRAGLTADRDAFLRSLDSPSAGYGATPETKLDKENRVWLALSDPELTRLSNAELKLYLGLAAATIQYFRLKFQRKGMLLPTPEPVADPADEKGQLKLK